MTIDEIKKFLADNKDDAAVKGFLAELSKVSPEAEKAAVQKWLEGDEGKKAIQSMKDKEVEKAIETWKTNNLEKLVAEEYNKKNPPKDPALAAMELRMKELEKLNADKEADLKRQALRNLVTADFTDAKINTKYADFLIGKDEDETKANIAAFKATREAEIKEIVDTKFKGLGRETPAGGDPKKTDLQTAYADAVKAGNMPAQIAIKRQAAKDGITIQ